MVHRLNDNVSVGLLLAYQKLILNLKRHCLNRQKLKFSVRVRFVNRVNDFHWI